jgi:hypothetical protein
VYVPESAGWLAALGVPAVLWIVMGRTESDPVPESIDPTPPRPRPMPPPTESGRTLTQDRFDRLATDWLCGMGYSSNPLVLTSHPSYRAIVAHGNEAVPFILARLGRSPGFLAWALFEITGENPAKQSEHGDLAGITRAWIEWGRDGGLIRKRRTVGLSRLLPMSAPTEEDTVDYPTGRDGHDRRDRPPSRGGQGEPEPAPRDPSPARPRYGTAAGALLVNLWNRVITAIVGDPDAASRRGRR